MFVRTKSFTRNNQTYDYLYLVENSRSNGKVVQKTIMSLGRIDDPKTTNRINQLISSLTGTNHEQTSLNLHSELSCNRAKIYGPLLIFKRLWKTLGIGKILKDSLYQYGTFFDLSECIFNMVLSRLIEPCSKRGMLEFQKDFYDQPPFELHQYNITGH